MQGWGTSPDATALSLFVDILCTCLQQLGCAVQVTDLIQEYFSSGDQAEALTALEEADEPELHHYFVKRLLTIALDKHDHEREMTSLLLSTMYSEVLKNLIILLVWPKLHDQFLRIWESIALRCGLTRNVSAVLQSWLGDWWTCWCSRSVALQVISPVQMQKGFTAVVDSIDDLQLDVPNAVEMVANFVERGVVDDILPPSFVKRFAGAWSSSQVFGLS
jgi:hypothetical protein